MSNPGCFGIPSVFSFKSRFCQSCEWFEDCQKQAYSALLCAEKTNEIRIAIERHELYQSNQSAPEKRKTRSQKKFVLTSSQAEELAKMPKRVSSYIRKCIERGDDLLFISKAKEGENPFPEIGARSLHHAYKLAQLRPITRDVLTSYFQTCLNWSKGAAAVETAFVWRVLKNIGLADEKGNALFVGPDIHRENQRIQAR